MFSDPMIKKFLVNWSRQKILCFGSVKDCNVGTSHQRGRKFSVLDPRSCKLKLPDVFHVGRCKIHFVELDWNVKLIRLLGIILRKCRKQGF